MSLKMEEEVKRWTAKRKSALVMEIIQGKTTVAEASRAYDLIGFYNNERPHQALSMRTPAAAFKLAA